MKTQYERNMDKLTSRSYDMWLDEGIEDEEEYDRDLVEELDLDLDLDNMKILKTSYYAIQVVFYS